MRKYDILLFSKVKHPSIYWYCYVRQRLLSTVILLGSRRTRKYSPSNFVWSRTCDSSALYSRLPAQLYSEGFETGLGKELGAEIVFWTLSRSLVAATCVIPSSPLNQRLWPRPITNSVCTSKTPLQLLQAFAERVNIPKTSVSLGDKMINLLRLSTCFGFDDSFRALSKLGTWN